MWRKIIRGFIQIQWCGYKAACVLNGSVWVRSLSSCLNLLLVLMQSLMKNEGQAEWFIPYSWFITSNRDFLSYYFTQKIYHFPNSFNFLNSYHNILCTSRVLGLLHAVMIHARKMSRLSPFQGCGAKARLAFSKMIPDSKIKQKPSELNARGPQVENIFQSYQKNQGDVVAW